MAKSTSDIGLFTVAPILFATTVYWCVGLRPEAGTFLTYLRLLIAQVSGGSVCKGRGCESRRERERRWRQGGETGAGALFAFMLFFIGQASGRSVCFICVGGLRER